MVRNLHEQIERLELAAAERLAAQPNSHKQRLLAETTVAAMIREISSLSQRLLQLGQTDADDADYDYSVSAFYKELESVDQNCRDSSHDDFNAAIASCTAQMDLIEAKFSGEEALGSYIDLIEHHQAFLNIVPDSRLDYLSYLEQFDNWGAVPESIRGTSRWAGYVHSLRMYFEDYFARAKPLFDVQRVVQEMRQQTLATDGHYCAPCGKTFSNAAVFAGHLKGKPHQRKAAVWECRKGNAILRDSVHFEETLVAKYVSILGNVRQETRNNVERKQSRTAEERLRDYEHEQNTTVPEVAEVPDAGDERLYNPLNLPLDWDGKPIPFWLWKLHGLGVRFDCEICGNYQYMGRRAFDQHFTDWRHVSGMKAIGVPNTRAFFQITTVKEALALWETIRKGTTRVDGSGTGRAAEEVEDHMGNVYSKKVYDDLVRQGLL